MEENNVIVRSHCFDNSTKGRCATPTIRNYGEKRQSETESIIRAVVERSITNVIVPFIEPRLDRMEIADIIESGRPTLSWCSPGRLTSWEQDVRS